MRKILAISLVLALLAGYAGNRISAATPVFGPVDVERQTSTPEVRRWTFQAAPSASGYLLCVDNGGQRDQYAPVTSANIVLNGAPTFQPRDFKRSVTTLSKPVPLAASNQLTVELAGAPGSGITLWILAGDSCAGQRTNIVPVITSTPVSSATLLQPYVYQVTAADADHDPLAFSLASAPQGMTITADTGEITWTPPGTGTMSAMVRVDDGQGGVATQAFAVTIGAPTNRPPHMVPVANRRIASGAPFRLALAADDPDVGDMLTFGLSGPTGAGMTGSLLAWTPGPSQTGFHPVTVTVHDAAGASDSASFTVEVVETAGAPLLDPLPDATTTPGTQFVRTVIAVDPNPGDALTFALVAGPSGLTLSPAGALAWTPTTAQLGSHPVTVEVTDSTGLSDAGAFTISVEAPSVVQPPRAVDDLYAVRKLTTLNVPAPGVLSNDSDPGGRPLTAQLVTPPVRGALSLSPNGGFSYTPAVPPPGSTAPQLAFAFAYQHAGNVGGTTRTQPLVADLYRDGTPDIIFMSSGVFADRRLIAVHGDTGAAAWNLNAYQPGGSPKIILSMGSAGGSSSLAAGDLDGDGYPEILAVHSDNEGDNINPTKLRNRLIAFDHDGTYRWTSDDIEDDINVTSTGGVFKMTIADLDGDGLPEILAKHTGQGPEVVFPFTQDFITAFNNDGHIRWTKRVPGFASDDQDDVIVADIDLDGSPEVVVAGAVLDNQGNVKWNIRTISSSLIMSYGAVANLDADPFAELVYVDRFGRLFCYEHTGAAKWGPVSRTNFDSYGLPTIGDVDGDGLPEIVLARGNPGGIIEVWDRAGNLVREMDTGFSTVGHGGNPTIFDLNGDGRPEVIYQSLHGSFDVPGAVGSLFIFDGPTGALLHEMYATRSSDTDIGAIVADVNGDGSAEIVTVGTGGAGTHDLIKVFKAASGHWTQTRPIWNQLAYHVTNVGSDARIPAQPAVNWLTPGLNNYRVNVPLPAERTQDADQFTYVADNGSLTSNVATVRIDLLPPNTAPRILSLPPLAAAGGIEYLYALRAVDPDVGEVLGYSLPQGPAGMTIDANTGLVRWTPPPAASGFALAVVKVIDSQGQSDSQQFSITLGPPATVPNVVGETTGGSQAILTAGGLTVGTVANAPSSTVAVGLVISQEPVAGAMVASGAGVNFVVSTGPAPVTVPHVIGKTETSAQALLTTSGFGVAVSRAFSNTVPNGVVMAQNPAGGTPLVPGSVGITVSAGSGLSLRLGREITTADAPIPFTAVAYDLTLAEVPAPSLTYVVMPAIAPSFGALPTVSMGNTIVPASDTRGAFRVTATDPATGRAASAEFAVTYPREQVAERTMSDALAGMSEVMRDIDTLAQRGRSALAANDSDTMRSLLNQIVQRWGQVDRFELLLATPFGLPEGFMPSPADLPGLGLTPTADDLLVQDVLKDADDDLRAWIDGLRAPSTSMATLGQLADQFNQRAARLDSLTMSEWGGIKGQALMTIVLTERLPELYDALARELESVVAAGGTPPPDAFASGPSDAEESTLAEETVVIATKFVVDKIADGINSYNISKFREKLIEKAVWTGAVVAASHHFKSVIQGQSLDAVIAGGSMSFHEFQADYSALEGALDTDQAGNNVVITLGPEVLEKQNLIASTAGLVVKNEFLNGALKAADLFLGMYKVYRWLTGAAPPGPDVMKIVEDSFQHPREGLKGCLFSSSPDCGQLVYENGFTSVYQVKKSEPYDVLSGIPVPILFIVYNKTTATTFVDLPVFLPTIVCDTGSPTKCP